MSPECPEIALCRDRRTADASHKATVITKLESIEKSLTALWSEMVVNRNDVKNLYFRIGLISGGTSLVVSLVVSLVARKL